MTIKHRAYIIPAVAAVTVLMPLGWLTELDYLAPLIMLSWGASLGMARATDKTCGMIIDDAVARGVCLVAIGFSLIGVTVAYITTFRGHLALIFLPLISFYVIAAYLSARGALLKLWLLSAAMTGAFICAMFYDNLAWLTIAVLIAALACIAGRTRFSALYVRPLIKSAGVRWILASASGFTLLILQLPGFGPACALCFMYFALIGAKRPDIDHRPAHVGRGAICTLTLITLALLTPLRGHFETATCSLMILACFFYTLINDRISPFAVGGAIYVAILPARAWLIRLRART